LAGDIVAEARTGLACAERAAAGERVAQSRHAASAAAPRR
jgi:hypothetical protein